MEDQSNLGIGVDSSRRNLPGNEWISDLSGPVLLAEPYFFHSPNPLSAFIKHLVYAMQSPHDMEEKYS